MYWVTKNKLCIKIEIPFTFTMKVILTCFLLSSIFFCRGTFQKMIFKTKMHQTISLTIKKEHFTNGKFLSSDFCNSST